MVIPPEGRFPYCALYRLSKRQFLVFTKLRACYSCPIRALWKCSLPGVPSYHRKRSQAWGRHCRSVTEL